MSLTISEKILSANINKKKVQPGELIRVDVDFAFCNDVTSQLALDFFYKSGAKKVFDNERIALIPDHFVPNKDLQTAELVKEMREFSLKHKIDHFFELGRMGIEHVLLPELGLVLPGEIIIGSDSHTCTYGALGAFTTGVGSSDLGAAMATGSVWLKIPESIKIVYSGRLRPWVGGKDLILYTIGQIGVDGATYKAIEFTGDVISTLGMDDRFTMSNMAVEAGAKVGIIPPDEITKSYVEKRAQRPPRYYHSDPDAHYESQLSWDISDLEPQVACPHSPGNVRPVTSLGDIIIDQAVIGSCTNGRISDLRRAAKILKGRKVSKKVRCIIFPGSTNVYSQALDEGLINIFIDAEAAISTPTCGPCLGGHMGLLADGERAISTTNRNFKGRMGHQGSEVYLSSPDVAAASAVAGYIVHPNAL